MRLVSSLLLLVSHYLCFLFVKVAGLILPEKSPSSEKSVLYLSPFFPGNAGYIYRAQKWSEILTAHGYKVDVKNTLNKDQFNKYLENNDLRFYLITLFKRTWQILTSYKYNTVIVRRELLLFYDYGNLFLEKFLLKIHPNAILDFDDDISYSKREPREITSLFGRLMLESGTKFRDSLLLYKKFIVASNYLKNYALEINDEITEEAICVIPTCVDYEAQPQKKYEPDFSPPTVNLGWIGTNGNLNLLNNIISQINEINKKTPVKLIVISGEQIKPEVDFEIENIMWSYESQIQDLLKIDVGLMPLNFTPEDKGKGGFKLIQYMGLGIVSVASAVTINNEIIDDKVNGFLVKPEDDWFEVLSGVLDSRAEFGKIGSLARRKIEENYSFLANKDRYIEFLEKNLQSS